MLPHVIIIIIRTRQRSLARLHFSHIIVLLLRIIIFEARYVS